MAKRKTAKRKKKPRVGDLPGISFEKAVARVQQLMEPDSVVSHNVTITDRRGIDRQFDVVIRGKFSGQEFLVVIECKDYGRNVGLDTVDEFAKKAEHVCANMRMIFARNGFSPNAIKAAKHEGIATLSLLPADKTTNQPCFVYWYGVAHTWEPEKHLRIEFDGAGPPKRCDETQICFGGMPVTEFFWHELMKCRDCVAGECTVDAVFKEPLIFTFAGVGFPVLRMSFSAIRLIQPKRARFPLYGDGFIDWQTGEPIFPKVLNFGFYDLDPNVPAWEDYDGPVNDGPNRFRIIHYSDSNETKRYPDLAPYCKELTVTCASCRP